MKPNIPRSPFTTRLSGSAKETELRLRNIFQWKKKRPPVVLFVLTIVVLFSCFGLVSCQVEPNEQPDDPVAESTPSGGDLPQDVEPSPDSEIPPLSADEFFASYVTDIPEYTYTGGKTAENNGHIFTMEDTPNNLAEAAVIDWYHLNWMDDTEKLGLVCGNELLKLASSSSYDSYTIHELSTLTPEEFTVENMPLLDAFFRWLSRDIQKFGLTEYTVVYVNHSWEWTPEHLALGPQLGNGRYEWLYLVGKTDADDAWKVYELYWGEGVFARTLEQYEPTYNLKPVGKEIYVDLNRDGAPENVLVDLVPGEYGVSYTLSINNKDYTSTLEQLGLYFDSPQEQFALTDLDAGDSYLEIALPDDGPSSDPHTVFLRWDGSALSSLGEVYGKVNDGDLTFDEAGTVSSTMRLNVLQTWFAPVQWQLNSDGVFAPVPQELYTPTYSQPVTALQELAAYADMDLNSERTSLPVGTQFSFFATDNARWVLCADERGEQFWLHLDEETGHSVELFDGSYSWSALDGLVMAD